MSPPPRIRFLHFPDFYTLFRQDRPVYYLGDLNARCGDLGSSNDNPISKQVKTIMEKGIANHDGPYFPTFTINRSKTSPDIILKKS